VELARETAVRCGHKLYPAPTLLTDHGSGFVSKVLDEYLGIHGIRHIYGKPYHPQTR